QTELERGVRLAEAVEVAAVERDLLARALHRERRQARGVECVYARRLLTALPGEHRAGCCVRVVPQDAARDRLALDSFHHEARAQPVVRLEQEPDPRRGDAAFVRSGEQLELDRAVRQPDRGPGIAAK